MSAHWHTSTALNQAPFTTGSFTANWDYMRQANTEKWILENPTTKNYSVYYGAYDT